MADAILTAEIQLRGHRLLILIADNLVPSTLLTAVIAKAGKAQAFAVVPGWKTPGYYPGGYLALKGDRITEIREKPGEGNEPSKYINVSGHYIKSSELLLSALKETKSNEDDIYERALSNLMSHQNVIMEPYEGSTTSLKYPWHLLDVMVLLLGQLTPKRGKNVVIKPNVIIEGPVIIGDNVKIFENTKIVGPSYIGNNTIVGNNNMIRASHIGDNCVIGFNCDITRSYIGNGCWLHSNYIGDSVLEADVSLGSGTVLANLRLDEGNISSMVQGQRLSTGR